MNLLSFTAAPHRACRSWRRAGCRIAYEIVPPLPAGEEPELMETGLPPIECTGPVGVALSDSGPGPHGTKPRAACGWLRGAQGGAVHMALAGIHAQRGSSLRYSFEV